MRYLLTIAILLMATSASSVDLKTYTVCESGGGCDYTTLQAAETAHEQDFPANDSALTFEIQNTWVSADGTTLVDGSVTDATRFIIITAVGAARAGATWSTTAYRAEGEGNVVAVQDSFTVIDGLQSKVTTSGDYSFRITTGGTKTTIKNCFGSAAGLSITRGIGVSVAGGIGIILRNNVLIDGGFAGIQISNALSGGVTADNNTIENCLNGISTTTGDIKARNNIFWNCTTPISGNLVELSQENYTDAASLDYGTCSDCGTGDQLSQSDPFLDFDSGEDYHLVVGATAIDAGQDLSGDFTDDIDGQTRDANFDKGADEFGQVTVISGTTNIDDAWMNASAPTLNYGTSLDLSVITTVRSTLIRAKNLSTEIPADATITKATFRLFCQLNSTDGTTNAYSVFKPWEEGTQSIEDCTSPGNSWDDWACDDNEWTTAGCECANDDGEDNTDDDGDCDASTKRDRKSTAESSVNVTTVDTWYEWDISNALAQAWYDGTKNEEGIILISPSGSNRFSSTESTSGNQPYFVFEYTLAGEPAGGTTLGGVTLEGVTVE